MTITWKTGTWRGMRGVIIGAAGKVKYYLTVDEDFGYICRANVGRDWTIIPSTGHDTVDSAKAACERHFAGL